MTDMKRISTFKALMATALLAVAAAFAIPASAQNAPAAEAFVQSNVQRGLGILNNHGLSAQDRSAQFRTFLLGLTDLRRIALYTLGPVKRTAPQADQNAFADAFRDYAFAVYEQEFNKYSGQTLKVTGSIQRANGDYLVTTQLIDPNAPRNQEPIEVDFRVFGTDGHFSVADITVVGLDLAITEQDEFTSFLSQHNNDVKALTADLKQRAERVRAGGSLTGK
jgi:phospholipid transport system substrate-binding protein